MNEPNTTQTPNDLFDVLMRDLGHAELKVLLWIVRQTYGWRRSWSDQGYTTIAATMAATGLSNRAVIDAYWSLERRKLAEARVNKGKGRSWRVLVKKVHHPSGEESSPSASE